MYCETTWLLISSSLGLILVHNNIIVNKKLITIFSDELVREKQEIVEENRRKEMIQDQKLVSHRLVFMKIFQTICTC